MQVSTALPHWHQNGHPCPDLSQKPLRSGIDSRFEWNATGSLDEAKRNPGNIQRMAYSA
jgi:hypothetical protein